MPKQKKGARANRRHSPKPAAVGAFTIGQRVKVVAEGHWAIGYEGAIRGQSDAGELVVQLDCKAVTHTFPAAQLAAL